MKKIIWFASVIALMMAGCSASDEKAEVSAQQNSLSADEAEGGNTDEGKQVGESSEKIPDVDQKSGESQGTEYEESTGCSSECPEDMVCVSGMCIKTTDDCIAPCDDASVCINGACVMRDDALGKNVCDPACSEGFFCAEGACIALLPKECDHACELGTTCIDGVCVKTAAPKDNYQQDCDGYAPCDPTDVCVSHHYCVGVCTSGDDITNKIDILYQVGVSQGDETAKPSFKLITDRDSLDAFLYDNHLLPVEAVDFDKDTILAITSGVSGMGVGFALSSACNVSGKSVMTAETRFCAGKPMDAALEWQWIMLQVPKDGNYDVEFITNNHYCLK